LVSAETFLSEKTVAHWVGETADVARRNENGVVGQDGTIHTENVVTFLDVFAPPVFLDVSFEFYAQGTVIPTTIKTAIQFCGLIDETSSFAEAHDFFHAGGISMCSVSHSY
jgi:hypothetical protein